VIATLVHQRAGELYIALLIIRDRTAWLGRHGVQRLEVSQLGGVYVNFVLTPRTARAG
jgi:hypothetical protein